MGQIELEVVAVLAIILFPATLMADFAQRAVRKSRVGVYLTEFISELTLVALVAFLLEAAVAHDAVALGLSAPNRHGVGYMLSLIALVSKLISWCFGMLHQEVIECSRPPRLGVDTWVGRAGLWCRSAIACTIVSAEIAMPVLIIGW